MIKYECDKCGKILSEKEVQTIDNFPVKERVTIIKGVNTIVTYLDRFVKKEIHLCADCYLKLLYFLDPDEKKEEK